MVIILMLRWWYGLGWRAAAQRYKRVLQGILRTFSVPLLLRTLFSPWKRVISFGDLSFQDRMRAVLDNVISRFVGFGVRILSLLAAVVALVTIGVVAGLGLIVWPLVPPLGVALIVRGVLPW